jgi:hypothetical protein
VFKRGTRVGQDARDVVLRFSTASIAGKVRGRTAASSAAVVWPTSSRQMVTDQRRRDRRA